MSADYVVVGQFQYIDDTLSAINRLRDKGIEPDQVYSPIPQHDLEEEVFKGKPKSNVRRFTMVGATCGCLGGFLMTCWMSSDWPLRTSAKSVLSIPAFVVIAFECTILIGSIITLLGMFALGRLPYLKRLPSFRPRFTDDLFGVAVRVEKGQSAAIEDEFRQSGAQIVETQYAR